MKKIFIMPIMALALVACTGNKAENQTSESDSTAESTVEETEIAVVPITSEWRLVDYPGDNNEMVTIPDDEDYLLILGEDGTFSMTTDCNTLNGTYTINGDSILFGENIMSTMRACPDEKIENYMKRTLPEISTYSITPDSTLRLRSDARIQATFKFVK